jgi:hypothetical protein
MVGAKNNFLAKREQRLDCLDRRRIIGRAILGHHDRRIADVEVHIACRDDFAVTLDEAGRGDGHDLQVGIEQGFGSIGVSRRVGVIRDRFRDGDASGRDESGEVVDMAVGVVVDEAVAEPHDAVRAKVALQPLLNHFLGQARVAVRIEQALFGCEENAGAVAIDRAAFQDPVGLGER